MKVETRLREELLQITSLVNAVQIKAARHNFS